ncbi:hypothetical protein ONS96_005596 [Cadophora gregata f. sp. sojae]|nr:hypothetical protein ONS96_005596 [Cadophora gregata f. sp. sojae]
MNNIHGVSMYGWLHLASALSRKCIETLIYSAREVRVGTKSCCLISSTTSPSLPYQNASAINSLYAAKVFNASTPQNVDLHASPSNHTLSKERVNYPTSKAPQSPSPSPPLSHHHHGSITAASSTTAHHTSYTLQSASQKNEATKRHHQAPNQLIVGSKERERERKNPPYPSPSQSYPIQ